MSQIWEHASKKNPCPICKRDNWCTFGERAMLCQRVESTHPASKGGWYHFYDNNVKPVYVPKAKAPPRQIDAHSMLFNWRKTTGELDIKSLAGNLGGHFAALVSMGVAYSARYGAWAFPMFDGDGSMIGIRLRNDEGFKWAVTGSRQGIFLPSPLVKVQPIAFLPEGPTDTAAGLSLGLYTIGRPTCMSGNDQVKAALKRLGIHRAVIVSDNDELKQLGPREGRPGIEGAAKIKKELGISSIIWIPPAPIKDLREFLNKGGTKELIESSIKNKVWSK